MTAMWLGLLPVLLGVAILALPARRRVLGPARTLAFAAAATVVLVELLPASAEALGAGAVVVFAAALLGPAALERALRGVVRDDEGVGRELGFLALVAHQVLDGVQMAVAASVMGLAVVLAIALHGMPLVAAGVLASEHQEGARRALLRGGLLVAATAGGMGLGAVLGTGPFEGVEPWLQAGVSGLLLHVLAHDLRADLPEDPVERTADLVALVVGVAAPIWLLERGSGHGHAHAELHPRFFEALGELALEAAPALVAGLVLAAALERVRPPASGGGAAAGLRLALTRPLEATQPVAAARRALLRGEGASAVVARLVAGPLLSVETLLLALVLLGPALALLFVVAAVVLALVAASVTAGPSASAASDGPEREAPPLLEVLDSLVLRTGPWIGVGLLSASYVEAYVLPGQLPGPLLALLLGLGAVVVRLPGPVAVLLAVVAWHGGVPTGALALLLLTGPSLHPDVLRLVGTTWGAAAAVRLGVVLLGGALVLAGILSLLPLGPVRSLHGDGHTHGPIAWASATLLGLAVVRALWEVGARGWGGTPSVTGGCETRHP